MLDGVFLEAIDGKDVYLVQDNRCAIAPCTILGGTDQAMLRLEQRASRTGGSDIDLDGIARMPPPRPDWIVCKQQAEIVVLANVEIGERDPPVAPVAEECRVTHADTRCHLAHLVERSALVQPIECRATTRRGFRK